MQRVPRARGLGGRGPRWDPRQGPRTIACPRFIQRCQCALSGDANHEDHDSRVLHPVRHPRRDGDEVALALDARTGRLLWRDRAVDSGFLWTVGDELFSLASDGVLAHARPTREGLNALDSFQLLRGEEVWSAPAMRGTRLFVKDDERILAVELGE